MKYHLSVIIPALNEQACLPTLLGELRGQRGVDLEIIVVDGGSTDRTVPRCRPLADRVVNSPAGRGRQLNAGYRESTGDNLLFLHADSTIRDPFLLINALQYWFQALEQGNTDTVAGHFPLKFIRTRRSNAAAFRYIEAKTHLNRANTTNGDQGFLLKRSFFDALGGFDESRHFLEDQILAERIRSRGTWITLPGTLYTSGRRFEAEGFKRRYILMSITMAMHTIGCDAFFNRAAGIYRNHDVSGHLLLKPFFKAAADMFRHDLGWNGSLKTWFLVGRYIRQNSWQLFFFMDVLFRTGTEGKKHPFLTFHDQYFTLITDNVIGDVITTALAFAWFMLVLAPWFTIVDSADRNP